jgi:hypothetical protein
VPNLVITLDDELKRLFNLETEWRKDIKKGPEVSQILQIVRDKMTRTNNEWIPVNVVRDRMADFSVNYVKSGEMIFQCVRERLLDRKRMRSYRGLQEECLKIV